jgi:hypothetical protein
VYNTILVFTEDDNGPGEATRDPVGVLEVFFLELGVRIRHELVFIEFIVNAVCVTQSIHLRTQALMLPSTLNAGIRKLSAEFIPGTCLGEHLYPRLYTPCI